MKTKMIQIKSNNFKVGEKVDLDWENVLQPRQVPIHFIFSRFKHSLYKKNSGKPNLITNNTKFSDVIFVSRQTKQKRTLQNITIEIFLTGIKCFISLSLFHHW